MAVDIVTEQGDALDALLALHYGADRVSDALPACLAANPGLAALGAVPPAGTRITLPDIDPATQTFSLW